MSRFGKMVYEDDPSSRCVKCGSTLIPVVHDPISNESKPIDVTKLIQASDIVLLMCEICGTFRIYHE